MFKNTLKRLGAIVMVLAMAMSVMAVTAFAEDTTIAKEYKTTAGNAVTVKPAEELTLAIQKKEAEDYSNANYATEANIPNITVTKAANSDNFSVVLPTNYEGIGKFTYTLQETAGNAAGVTYNTDTIKIVVLRTWNDDKTGVVTNVYVQNAGGTAKVDKITNKFDTGSLTVTKELSGDFANPNYEFDIKVTLSVPSGKEVKNTIQVNGTDVAASAWQNGKYETTVKLKGGASATFTNLPAGVTYEVSEEPQDSHTVKSIDYKDTTKTISANDTDEVIVTNEKNSSPVTGVIMNIAPYVLMVALAGGIAFFFLRRRNAE